MRWAILGLVSVLVVVAVVVGLGQTGGGGEEPAPAKSLNADAALAGSPPELDDLHKQSSQLIGGGRAAFEKRRGDLIGYPVVVNAWASWCGPCRFEFPFFQRQSVELGKQVAFLGVDVTDNNEDARRFLTRFPVSFPTYEDPKGDIARSLTPSQGLPNTAFYDKDGRQTYIHQGGYSSEAALRRDIERYALGQK